MLTSKQKEKCHEMTKGSKIRYAVDDKHKANLEQAGYVCTNEVKATKTIEAKSTLTTKGLNTTSKVSEEKKETTESSPSNSESEQQDPPTIKHIRRK
jgi:hypothetical protein